MPQVTDHDPREYGKGSRFRDSLLLHSPSVSEQPQPPAGKGCHTQTQHVARTRFAFCSHQQQESYRQQHDVESTLHGYIILKLLSMSFLSI